MKVALLKRILSNIGGLEKQTHRLAKAFSDHGCDVTLVSQDQTPNYDHRPLSSFDKKSISHFDVVLGIDRLPFQTHIRAGNGVHAAYLKTKRWTDQFLPKHRKELRLEKQALLEPALRHIITNSEMVRQQYIEFYNINERQVSTIHNGVEWEAFDTAYEQHLQKPQGPYHFLFVGNDLKRKGLLPLLHALSHLKSDDWKLTVLGSDRRLKAFKTLSKGLGISDRVHFAGKQADSTPYYVDADCLVLPSTYDPFANVTIEALAIGLEVITTKTNGGSEVLQDETGQIVSNATELHDAMQHAMHSPKDPARCRASVKDLDFNIQLNKFVDLCLST